MTAAPRRPWSAAPGDHPRNPPKKSRPSSNAQSRTVRAIPTNIGGRGAPEGRPSVDATPRKARRRRNRRICLMAQGAWAIRRCRGGAFRFRNIIGRAGRFRPGLRDRRRGFGRIGIGRRPKRGVGISGLNRRRAAHYAYRATGSETSTHSPYAGKNPDISDRAMSPRSGAGPHGGYAKRSMAVAIANRLPSCIGSCDARYWGIGRNWRRRGVGIWPISPGALGGWVFELRRRAAYPAPYGPRRFSRPFLLFLAPDEAEAPIPPTPS